MRSTGVQKKNQTKICYILGSAKKGKYVDLGVMNIAHIQNMKICQICYSV
jgi:hypothetical protein